MNGNAARTWRWREKRGEYVSVQRGFWRSLWLVLRGARVREWELWPRDKAEALTMDGD